MAPAAATSPGHLRRILLGLLGPREDLWREALLLDRAGWEALNALANQHRIDAHLHGRLARGELRIKVPPFVADRWREVHREWGLVALRQRADLFDAVRALGGAGIDSVALKGSWLAWHAWPNAAERPKRDLDLLVPTNRALDAFYILRAAGYRQDIASARLPEEMVGNAKHMPQLTSPRGTVLEVHMHAWEPPGSLDHPMPPPDDAAILAGAIGYADGDPVRYPARHHMFAHLVIHAVYGGRLDTGPLVLGDIDYLLRSGAVDWPRLWDDARQGGWLRGAALLVALVDRWRLPGLVQRAGCPVAVDDSVLDEAADLLLQDLTRRKSSGLLAGLRDSYADAGLAGLAARAAERLRGTNRARHPGSGSAAAGTTYLAWLARRSGETLAQLRSREARSISASASKLGRWLDASD